MNSQKVEDEWIREEARLLREQVRAEMPDADELTVQLRVREWARENVIMRVLFDQAEEAAAVVTAQVPRPSSKEITLYYRKFSMHFQAPELVRAAHIVKHIDEGRSEQEAECAIRAIEAKLKAGVDFAKLADSDSDCPGKGGDLGLVARGDMVEEFERVLFALRPGEVSPIFRTIFGLHIAKALEKRPPGLKPLSEVRDAIEQGLWQRRKEIALKEFMESLRAKADIRKA